MNTPKTGIASERKDQIVRATVECITQHGYNNFSMQDVAKTAGVSKGIIHYYFLNKDELMMSVLDKVAGDIENILAQEMNEKANPTTNLEIIIDVCFDVVRSTKEYYQVNMDFWTQINQKERVRNVITKHYCKFRETISKILNAGMESGDFRKLNPHNTSSFIIAAIDGLSLQWLFDSDVFDYNEVTQETKQAILETVKKR